MLFDIAPDAKTINVHPMQAKPNSSLHFVAAFLTGGLLSLMILFNGTLASYGSLFFASWVPHLTGTVAALVFLAVMRPKRAAAQRPPLWVYLGGVSGAITVMLTSATLNSALALSGTIALGLAGQMIFSLFADMRGMFGLPQRMPVSRDYLAVMLVIGGSLILIFFGGAA